MTKPNDNLQAIAEQQLGESLSTWADILQMAQEQGWLKSLHFDRKALNDALFVFGTVAKLIGYETGEVSDDNVAEKIDCLLRAVANIVGKDYLFPPKIEINK